MADAASAILAALDDGRVSVRAALEIAAGATDAPAADIDERATEQFIRAFESLLREALQGGSELRPLVLDAAVPALVARGTGALDLVERQVALFVVLTGATVDAVDAADRPGVEAWMAHYASMHIRDIAERALAAERVGGEGPA